MDDSMSNKEEREKNLHKDKKHEENEMKKMQEQKQEQKDTSSEAETVAVSADTQNLTEESGEEKAGKAPPVKETTEVLETQITELKDMLLRKQAEFENFRKRIQREKEESIKYANAMLLLDLTNTIDDFERAIQSAKDSEDFRSFHSGVELIEKQLTQMLENKWGLKRFESKGEKFDPDRHEAIMAEESDQVSAPTVVEDFQRGYLLHERVLRPAKVKVAQPVEGKS
jgi:molecular chaperone GrpE